MKVEGDAISAPAAIDVAAAPASAFVVGAGEHDDMLDLTLYSGV